MSDTIVRGSRIFRTILGISFFAIASSDFPLWNIGLIPILTLFVIGFWPDFPWRSHIFKTVFDLSEFDFFYGNGKSDYSEKFSFPFFLNDCSWWWSRLTYRSSIFPRWAVLFLRCRMFEFSILECWSPLGIFLNYYRDLFSLIVVLS